MEWLSDQTVISSSDQRRQMRPWGFGVAVLAVILCLPSIHAAPTLLCDAGWQTLNSSNGTGVLVGAVDAPSTNELESVTLCRFVIGSLGHSTFLTNLTADGDPTSTYLFIYDGPSEDPAMQVLRLQGNLWSKGAAAPLFPLEAPLYSRSGIFTLVWYQGSEFAGPGAGLRASYAIAPLAVPDPLVLGLDQQSPLPVAPQQLQSVSVASTAGLLRAAVDPAITLITVSAHLRLNGTTLVVDGPGRSLTVQSDPLACGSLSRGAVPGLCTLDAGSLARHFQVSGGAQLRLLNLDIRGGSALQGGSVAAVGAGTRFVAEGCVFADSRAVGDGGAVLALAGADVRLSSCAIRNASSLAGSGGGVASISRSAVAIRNSSLEGCSAQQGGGASALFSSSLILDGCSLRSNSAFLGGGVGFMNSSIGVIEGSSFSDSSSLTMGGAISAKWYSSVAVTGCTLADNRAAYDGGCAHCWRESFFKMTNSTCLRGVGTERGATGGGLSAWYGNITLVGSVISSCSSPSPGGGLYLWHSVAAVYRTQFANNTASDGGAIHVEGGAASTACPLGTIGCALSAILIDSSRVEGNSVAGNGGGAFCDGAVTLVIRGSWFSDNEALGHGGGLSFASPAEALSIDGSTFVYNSAGLGGGGIAILGASSAHVGTSIVSGNRALSGDGGGIEIVDTPLSTLCIMGATQQATGIKGSLSVTAGGGMPSERDYTCTWQITPESVLLLNDCVVELDIADVEIVSGISPTIPAMAIRATDNRTGSQLFYCKGTDCDPSVDRATVVRSSDSSGLTLTYSWFSGGDNIGLRYGMRAAWRSVCGVGQATQVSGDVFAVDIAASSIVNNSCPGNGGGLSLIAVDGLSRGRLSAVSITQSLIEANQAGLSGGGIFAPSRLNVTVAGTTVRMNRAEAGEGGCMALGNGSAVALSESFCISNRAGGDGGGLFLGSSAVLSLVDASLAGNTAAGSAGALSLGQNTAAFATNSELASNSAGSMGGAVQLSQGSSFTASSTAVVGNIAELGGGAFFFARRGALTLTSCRIRDNSAFSGAFVGFSDDRATGSNVTLRDLDLSGNTATAGGLFGVIKSPVAFAIPACVDCRVRLTQPLSYGAEAATPPVRYDVNISREGGEPQTRPGDRILVGLSAHLRPRPPASIYDAFDQRVLSYPSLLASISCISRRPTDIAAPLRQSVPGRRLLASAALQGPHSEASIACEPGTLNGPVDVVYRDGAAIFEPLLLGFPSMDYTLQVSFRLFGSDTLFLMPSMANVTVAGCGPLEQFFPSKRICDCIDVAARDAANVCRCAAGASLDSSGACVVTRTRFPLGIVLGCTIGGGALLLVVVALAVARRQSRRAHEMYRLPMFHMQRREEEMAAAVKAQSELSAMLGHEIRTPANVLSGAALLLAGTEMSLEQRELVQVMQAGVKSMTHLIADMLALSRLDAGKFPLDPLPTNIRKGIVDQALRMIELHQQQRGVGGMLRITKRVDESVPEFCYADAARVQQILLNSLTNACKFTKVGGSVTIDCSVSEIRPVRAGEGLASDELNGGGGPITAAVRRRASGAHARSSGATRVGTDGASSTIGGRSSTNISHASVDPVTGLPCSSVASSGAAAGGGTDHRRASGGFRRSSVRSARSVEDVRDAARQLSEVFISGLRRLTQRASTVNAAGHNTASGATTRENSRRDPLEEFLVFRICDSGVGISKDDLQRIFEPFSQAAEGKKSLYGGTGALMLPDSRSFPESLGAAWLGLAICKRLAHAMGGEIFADSEGAGKGTMVTFYLPLQRASEPADDEAGATFPVDCSLRGLAAYPIQDTPQAIHSALPSAGADGAQPGPPDAAPGEAPVGAETYVGDQLWQMVQDPGPGSLRGIQAGQQSAAAAGAAAPSGGNPRMLGRIQSFALARAQPQSTGSHSSSSQASQATAPPPPPPPVVAGRVLAAEDDRASQLILKKTLERMGFDPLVVGDGQQALDAWRDDPGGWDLIIVDYNMPLLTGPETARAIQEICSRESLWKPPIVALCGATSPEELKECADAGCVRHIAKPMTRKALEELRSLVAEARARRTDFIEQKRRRSLDAQLVAAEAETARARAEAQARAETRAGAQHRGHRSVDGGRGAVGGQNAAPALSGEFLDPLDFKI